MLRPTWAVKKPSAEVLSCICCQVCYSRARLSSCVQRVHLMPFLFSSVICLITQSMASRNRNVERRHPCRTLVSTWTARVSLCAGCWRLFGSPQSWHMAVRSNPGYVQQWSRLWQSDPCRNSLMPACRSLNLPSTLSFIVSSKSILLLIFLGTDRRVMLW